MTPSVLPVQAGNRGARIALLGARGTGKTQLANELAAHLEARGLRAFVVPEALRAWCSREGRSPGPEEQFAIARAQEAAVDAAAAQADFVIADTTALMVAIHAGMLREDDALYRFALERQQACDATLVTGLDLAWVPDGLQRDAASREETDALVRTLLQRAGVAFQVVYGQGPRRLQAALQALVSAGALPAEVVDRAADGGSQRAWVWVCEKCSDPACEHRLFTQLREARG